MTCIVCGKNPPALGGLCAPCLGERKRFVEVPPFCELTVCAHCGSVFKGRRWENSRGEEAELEDAARRALKVSREEGVEISSKVTVKPVNEHNADAEVSSTVKVGKSRLVQSGQTRIRIRRAVCERCSKMHGRYYEATLQVRAQGRALTADELDLVRSRVGALVKKDDRDDYVRKEDEVDGGLDFQLGKLLRGKTMVRSLAQELGGRVTESSTLAGNKEGRELFRVTFLLRLPAFRPGDFVKLEGRVLLVTAVGPNGVSATDLQNGEPGTLDGRSEERARRLGGSEMVEVAVVLDARMPEVTIMDPVGYRPVTVVAPDWFWARKRPENVRILKSGEDVFLVPDG
jgi:nonsense-mediated mRNA decay protein 3